MKGELTGQRKRRVHFRVRRVQHEDLSLESHASMACCELACGETWQEGRQEAGGTRRRRLRAWIGFCRQRGVRGHFGSEVQNSEALSSLACGSAYPTLPVDGAMLPCPLQVPGGEEGRCSQQG